MPSDTEITPEWCLNMARLEGNAEIGAGSLDHPLRSLTPAASEATAIGVGEGLSPRALHWRLMGLAATLRSDQFDEDDASARDIEEAARRLAAASPKVASDTAISGLNPKPGHSEGCGAHDDYACDCGKVASDTAPGVRS